jgi:CheY-like chemotaxis protein
MVHRSLPPYVASVRVLICDDEPHVRLVYRAAFEDCGADVTEAVDGDDCLEQLATGCPDLVILDLFMPDRDGLSALPELRQRCSAARVLIVSVNDAAEVFERCRERGATACFDKVSFAARIPRIVEHYGAA